jgi:hypothetical protein
MNTINRKFRNIMTVVSGITVLFLAGQASAGETKDAVSIDRHCSAAAAEHLSAHEARRRAYDYMTDLGYAKSGVGAARIQGITRDGETWIAKVAYSNGGRTLSNKAVLYIDSHTAMVSEVPPGNADVSVAANP